MKSQVRQIRPKIYVGMSGGVDSSVSAALLKNAGFDITGVFIKVWQPDWIECNWKEERLEAMRVAAHLGIPFVTLDLVDEYKKGVIDYMIHEYSVGRTPNPDVMCNREVKFGAFWRWAKDHGADYIATGHYAQIKEIRDGKAQEIGDWRLEIRKSHEPQVSSSKSPVSSLKSHISSLQMLVGADANKDQTYFLWTLNQDDLKHIMFPVGHLEKSEVRKLAKKFKLPNADKKDSQGLCFIGKIDVKEFLSHYIKQKPGKVLNENEEIIGTHNGALLITIGERRGFTIDAKHKTANDVPYYVMSKDVSKNTVTVGQRVKSKEVRDKEITNLISVNWVNTAPAVGTKLQARTRYRQQLQDIEIISIDVKNCSVVVEFNVEQDTITPGQSLVMYDGEICLGGGIIE